MNKVQHMSNNAVLGAPAGWDQGQLHCDALPVTVADWNGHAAILSFWKPTDEELELLLQGCSVVLSVVGTTMPPVALTVMP